MGRSGKDKGKRSDRGRDQRREQERDQRRKVTEARKQAEARKIGQEAGHRARGAELPKSSTLDTALHVGGLAAEAVGHAAEFAGEGALAGSAAMGGIAAYGITQGREIVKAIGETHDAHKAECHALGARHAVSWMMQDAKGQDNPHIRDGKPYTREDFNKKVDQTFGRDREHWMKSLLIENKDGRKDYRSGINQMVDAANKVLQQGKTPAERQQGMQGFTNSAASAMAEQRKKWNQAASGQPQS